LQEYWSRSAPLGFDDFKRRVHRNRLSAVGVGPYFEPVACSEALVVCLIPLSEAIGNPDFRLRPDLSPLNALAAWAREHAIPGGAQSWQRNVGFACKESK